MSGFFSGNDGNFDRVFMTTTDLIDQFVGESLWGAGSNNTGALGDNTSSFRSSLVQVTGSAVTWRQVAAGSANFAAIKTDGTLWTCGYNFYGALGDNTSSNRSSPVTTTGGGTNWKQVSRGYNSLAAIKTDGTLWTCGYNFDGNLGDNTTVSKSSPVTTAGGGTNWKQSAMGHNHAAAIKTDGTLWCWGFNTSGELGDGTATTKSSPVTTSGGGTTWKQVACGSTNTGAIKTDGTLWMWGSNNGALADGTSSNRSSPVTTVAGGTNWKQIAMGNDSVHIAAIKTDGTLWTWGSNTTGQLGDNTSSFRSSPVTTVAGGTNWKQVSVGNATSSAIKTDGTLWTWGNNSVGQLGDNTTSNRSSPIQPLGSFNNWKQVSVGAGVIMGIAQKV